jgi:hypothetical protein
MMLPISDQGIEEFYNTTFPTSIKSHAQTAQSRNHSPKEKSQSLLKTWLFVIRQLPASLLSFQSSPK